MENFNEFSSIEQAAMEQSSAHETDVHHNFIETSCFIDCVEAVTKEATHATNITVTTTSDPGAVVDTPIVVEATGGKVTVAAAAGGVVVDGVFTKQQVQLLKSVDQECSIYELIGLRKSLISANRVQK